MYDGAVGTAHGSDASIRPARKSLISPRLAAVVTVAAGALAMLALAFGNEDAGPLPDAALGEDAGAAGATVLGEPAAEDAPVDATPVHIGVYLLDIHEVDLKSGTAVVTFYIWTRWRGDVDGTAYELMNGTVEDKSHEYKEDVDGEHYAYYRIRATVRIKFDFRRFPFDSHRLALEFEHDNDEVETTYWVPDRDGMRYLGSPAVAGWAVSLPRYEVSTSDYHTNWGAPGAPPDQHTYYSHFRLEVDLRHGGWANFAKTFLTLFISVLIAFSSYLVHPEYLDSRVGVGVAGVFGVVTSQIVVAQNLPEVAYLTLSDVVHLGGLAAVFLTLLGACLVAHLFRTEREALALQVDTIVGGIIAGGYVLFVVAMIAF